MQLKHHTWASSIAVSRDGRYFAAASFSNVVYVYETAERYAVGGRSALYLPRILTHLASLCFRLEIQNLYIAGKEYIHCSHACLYRSLIRELRVHNDGIVVIAFSVRGTELLCGTSSGHVQVLVL
jgi:WD40 repeat protein